MHEEEQEIEIIKLITAMATFYPNVKIADGLVNGYVSLLKDLPLEHLTTAIEQVTGESEFFPTVAKIPDRALSLIHPPDMPALEAWEAVLREISRVGRYRSPTFENPIIAKSVDCIGWQQLCDSENQVADRAHFKQIYDQLVTRKQEDQRLLPRARNLKEIVAQAAEQKQIRG